MVFDEQYDKKPIPYVESPKRTTAFSGYSTYDAQVQMAHPKDRFGAFIIDLVSVLIPVIFFVTAPLRQRILKSTFLADQEQIILMSVVFTLSLLLVLWIYQSFMVWRYGATLGKMFFNLRVIDVWTKKSPTLTQSFLRSLVWSLEALLLFIPNMSILSNHLRRPFHDRLFDLMVITLKKEKSVGHPNILEKSFVKSFYTSSSLLAVLILTMIFSSVKKGLVQSWQETGVSESDTYKVCESVTQSYKNWSGEKKSRISVALTLFGGQLIDRDCFKQEIAYAFEQQNESDMDLTYLSQMILNLDGQNNDLKDEYIEKICSFPKSKASCLLAKSIDVSSDDFWKQMVNLFKTQEAPLYFKTWALRRYLDEERFSYAYKLLDLLPPESQLALFLSRARAQTYLAQQKSTEFLLSERTMLEQENVDTPTDFSAWSCYHQLQANCHQQKSLSCLAYKQNLKRTLSSVREPLLLVTYAKILDCKNMGADYIQSHLREVGYGSLARTYMESLHIIKNGPIEKSRELVSLLLEKHSIDDVYKMDLLNQWLEYIIQNKSLEDMKTLYQSWLHMDRGLIWQKMGYSFMNFYQGERQDLQLAQTGLNLLSYQKRTSFKESQSNQWLVTALYRLNNKEMAWKIYKHAFMESKSKNNKNEEMTRSLASVPPGFSRLTQKLKQEFGVK